LPRGRDDHSQDIYDATLDESLTELVAHLIANPTKIPIILKIAMKDSIVCLKAKEDNTKFHKTLIRLNSIPQKYLGELLSKWYPVLDDVRLKALDQNDQDRDGIYKAFFYETQTSGATKIPFACHHKIVFDAVFTNRREALGCPLKEYLGTYIANQDLCESPHTHSYRSI
jgi:hypothetical protein